jgi:SAM-dependent methyltransferase
VEKQGIHVAVVSHYEVSANLEARLRNLLTESRAFSGSISPEDLAGLDQFHAGGLAATAELSELLTITRKTRVLDVGSGLGGPSRYLAYRFGCHVWGVELSESYCQTARMIARLMELDDEVSYQRADALNLPFQDHSFDIVWTQHVVMNIEDRVSLYKEFARVVRPHGYLAFYDVVQSQGGPLHFPVPWARDASLSHLLTADETHAILVKAGFQCHAWENVTGNALEWFKARERSQALAGKPHLDLQTVMGEQFPTMIRNYRRNLEENRCGVLQAVLQKCSETEDCHSGGCH